MNMNDKFCSYFPSWHLNKSVLLIGKTLSFRPEEENEKGEELKGEGQEDETEDQVSYWVIEIVKHPNLAVQEDLEERVKDVTELGDIRSLDIAMAIAAGEILEFEK